MKPPMAEPIVKPQNMSVTSDERRAFGQYSEAMVMVVGIAPPRPMPVTNLSQVNDCRSVLSADARLALPNSSIDAISNVLRP